MVAADTDIAGDVMGEKGNISADTTLYLKNLNSSYFLKVIYAKANSDFTGGETLSSGTVTQADIDTLHQKLIEQASTQMKDIIRQEFIIPDTVLLYFDSLFSVQINGFTSIQTPGEESSIVE
ncbi:MAG: hypothetical protein H6766_00595 [Candidatus Peribacteria bacterium]|nr:MAG: hypothetical protein H6766_00595 [Candidatus Peribacteria bacterium]